MSQVLLWFILPIGLYTYFVIEKKNKLIYQNTFDTFQKEISQNDKLADDEKIKLYTQMLIKNGYSITKRTKHTVVGEQKIISLGLIMIGVGLYMIGLLIYLIYFYAFQKPHVVEYKI